MAVKVRPLALLAVTVVIASAVLLLVSLLPHDSYVRFQQLSRESLHYMRVKWIYERIHFDATPIDIAFIGTSHTQSGVNSGKVQATLAAQGDPRHVVNFAVPHLGRDMHYLIARELLAHRHVDTLVIEIQEVESRAPHPGFQRLATASDIAAAPMVINTGLVENFSRLPMRQLELFSKTRWPAWFGMQTEFEPGQYEGPHFDDTYRLHGTTIPRTGVHTRDYFAKELRVVEADVARKRGTAQLLEKGYSTEVLLYRYNNTYLKKLLDMAQRQKVKVVFMYLPFLGAKLAPEGRDFYAQYGPVMVPASVIGDEKLWQNATHLNYFGANALSAWLAASLPQPLTAAR